MSSTIAFTLILVLATWFIGCKPSSKSDIPKVDRMLPPAGNTSEVQPSGGYIPDLATFQSSVQASPDDVFLRFDYMSALKDAEKYDEALDQARTLGALEKNPLRGPAYLNFAQIVLEKIPADDPRRPELIKEATTYIKIAVDEEPGSIPAHITLGKLALESGDPDTAIHNLSIALAAVEIGYELRMQLAEAYINKGEGAKARPILEMAKSLASDAKDKKAVRKINGLMSKAR
jgi:tetratricopeptide (TPR) repeat protein